MDRCIRVTVAALVQRDGRFLLVEEDIAGRRVLNQPAGHLEPGESLPEAAARETLEETGWTFDPGAVVGIYLWRAPNEGSTFLRVAFTGECRDHDAGRALDEGILGTVWRTRDELRTERERLRSPLVLRCIDDYLAGVRYPLQCLTRIPGRDEARTR